MQNYKDNRKYRVFAHTRPDAQGRIMHTVCWIADYHPGHPLGEYRKAWRAQVHFSKLNPNKAKIAIWDPDQSLVKTAMEENCG